MMWSFVFYVKRMRELADDANGANFFSYQISTPCLMVLERDGCDVVM